MIFVKLVLAVFNRLLGRINETQFLSILLAVLSAVLASTALIISLPKLVKGLGLHGRIWSRLSGEKADGGLGEYYGVLGLRPGANQDEIKAAYRELVKRYHPDRLPYSMEPGVRREMEERMKMINIAYKALTFQPATPNLNLSMFRSDLDEVVRYISESEWCLRRPDGAVHSLGNLHSAAERLVQTLHKASSSDQAAKHYYDMLSDLLMDDVIKLEEFELLSNIRRRWSDLRRGHSLKNREVAVLARRLKLTYDEILRRFTG